MIALEQATGKRTPLVFDSPHSGTSYPDDFTFVIDHMQLRRAEDTYVHELYDHVMEQGAPLLHALFPRSYLDLNRSPEDIDPQMIDGKWPHALAPGDKTSRGMGLIWRRMHDLGELYDRKLSVAEVEERIETCWRPYHRQLEKLIGETREQFGICYHIDCHSMPSFGDESTIDGPVARAEFVLGDRDGTTCAPAFTDFVAKLLRSRGYDVVLNDPYKGVELVQAYSNPLKGRHSLQVEINRMLYMDEKTMEKNQGFDALKADLQWFTSELAKYALQQTS